MSRKKVRREPCGCETTLEPEAYVSMCSACAAEYRETRKRWHEEHKAREADREAFFAMPAGPELSKVKTLKM